jgi:hypothetical protein
VDIRGLEGALQVLVTRQLGAITFVQDYWQLAFDGPVLTVLTRIAIIGSDWRVDDGADQFRNRLCERIAKVVAAVSHRSRESILITFEDAVAIEISLREGDFTGPEGCLFRPDPRRELYVVQAGQ